MRSRHTALALTGAAVLVIAPLLGVPAAPAAVTAPPGCECWRYVRPSTESASAVLEDVASASMTVAWATGKRDQRPLLVKWNGTRWLEVPTPLPADTSLTGVTATSPKDLWVVGHDGYGKPRMARWSSGKWQRPVVLPPAEPSFPEAAYARSPDDVWLAGHTRGFTGPLAATWHWDGKKWLKVPVPGNVTVPSGLSAVEATAADDAWAVGFRGAKASRPLQLHWNGKDWKQVVSPSIPGESALKDVVALGRNNAWAVGWSLKSTGGKYPYRPLAEHWDGRSWKVVPVPGNARGRFYSVTGDGRTGVWASGVDNTGRALLAHWGGRRWAFSTIPVPDPSGDGDARGPAAIQALTNIPGTSYIRAVGSYGRVADPVRHAITWTNSPCPG